MYLAPHHFQAQNRYFEDSIQFATGSLWRFAYGFADLQLHPDSLRSGTIRLLSARGMFEDGLPFDIPESDPAPAPLEIASKFQPQAELVTVFLCVPPLSTNRGNCTFESNSADSSRYTGVLEAFRDENKGYEDKLIMVGRKNLRISLQEEADSALSSLPVARIMRDGSGHFMADPSFMAPSLRLDVNESMVSLLRRLVKILETKSAAVSQEQAQLSSSRFGQAMSERSVSQFWFLHAVNSALAELRHLLLSKHGHPEELFRAMSRLAGALCTFDVDAHPRSLPSYDHSNPANCLLALDEHIRRLLELNVPSQSILIRLNPLHRYFYMGDVKDERCLGRSRWILGIHSPIGEADLIDKTSQLVKVCSAKFIPELVKRALPGLALTHIQVPPSAISAKVDHQYFSISRSGPCWDTIMATRGVGIYVPGELPSPELELIVMIEV
jgi:type VI secretion system protein ImpJ